MGSNQQLTLHNPPHSPLSKVGNGVLESENVVRWNTANLGMRLGADAMSAATASALVAPIICVIDRSIVTKAATNTPLSQCLAQSIKPALLRPHNFLISRPFLLIFSLYFSTYLTANTVDTVMSTINSRASDSVTSSKTKFLATSAVNMTACVYKDSQFAKMFSGGRSSAAATIPKMTYILFAARDSMTIFASFNLPPLLSQKLKDVPPVVKQKFSRILSTDSARTNTAQFIAPAAMQVFSTPIHLLGLDLYNRQQRLGFGERFSRICRDWTVSAVARMGRIVPAFGVGGVVNGQMRRGMMQTMDGSSTRF